jgi:GNAT superfamily N-acetyltransferase
MEIRELSASRDGEEIARCLALLYSELFGPSSVLSEADSRAALEQWQRGGHPHWAFQAVEGSGRVAAFFTLAESFAFFAHGRYGILNELWVNPELRSQGIGEQVIDFCVRFARERGWERIDVSAPPSAEWDRTFAFYQKRGFALTGRKLKILVPRLEVAR